VVDALQFASGGAGSKWELGGSPAKWGVFDIMLKCGGDHGYPVRGGEGGGQMVRGGVVVSDEC